MKKFLKIFGAIVLAAALVSVGYFMGSRAGENSITSALPHMSIEHSEPLSEYTAPPTENAASEPEKTVEKEPEQAKENAVTEPEKTGRTVVKADESAAEDSWSTLKRYSCDLFETGEDAEIVLYTSAYTEDGEVIWDDGQNWVLEVSDGEGGYYTLLDRYVNNGNIYFEVSELENEKKAINVFIKTGAGLEVKQYTYGENGFVETSLYNSGSINTLYSSIPYYE